MLVVQDLTVSFPSRHGDFTAIRDVSINILGDFLRDVFNPRLR